MMPSIPTTDAGALRVTCAPPARPCTVGRVRRLAPQRHPVRVRGRLP